MVGFIVKYFEIRNCIFIDKFVFYNVRVLSLFKFGLFLWICLVRSRCYRVVMD